MAKTSPFGKTQERLFLFIIKHPGCTAAQIREDEFPDRDSRYVNNLLYENTHPTTGMIERRTIGEGIPTEFHMKFKKLFELIDFKTYIQTGKFCTPEVQGELPLNQE